MSHHRLTDSNQSKVSSFQFPVSSPGRLDTLSDRKRGTADIHGQELYIARRTDICVIHTKEKIDWDDLYARLVIFRGRYSCQRVWWFDEPAKNTIRVGKINPAKTISITESKKSTGRVSLQYLCRRLYDTVKNYLDREARNIADLLTIFPYETCHVADLHFFGAKLKSSFLES